MMNQVKEESQKARQSEVRRTREVNQLKKVQRSKENQIRQLELEKRQKENILKRKQQEVGSEWLFGSSVLCPEMVNWVWLKVCM